MTRTVRLCHASELAESSSRGFDPDGAGRDTMFVVRRGGLYGWRNGCPHWAGTPMAWRKDAYLSGDSQHIVCAAHGAQFDIANGLCTLGPCLGQRLTPLPLILTPAGDLEVVLPDTPETSA